MKFTQVMALVGMNELPALARHAEAVGFEALALGEHFVTFKQQYEVYDYSKDGVVLWYPETHWPDPWVMFAALAQVTQKIRFITTVCVVPMRETFALAKSISTAAQISNNRVILGAGIGWQEKEFEMVHQSFRNRGKRADEMLQVIELLMSGAMVSFEGEFHRFEPLQMSPGVTQRVPVLIGGKSPAAFRRAARHDGWIGGSMDLDELPEIVAALKRERRALGKSLSDPFEIQLSLHEYTPEIVKRAEDMGVTQIHKDAWLDENGRASRMTLEQKLHAMEDFAGRFMR
jgi:probable F420-dependent oxidoreductase